MLSLSSHTVIYVVALTMLTAAPALGDDALAAGDEEASQEVTQSTAEPVEIAITGTEFAYTPNRVEVQVGQPVRLVFTNGGQITHSVSIPGLSLRTEAIQPGETVTLVFTPEASETLTFECTVAGHAMVGMTGEIVVLAERGPS